MGVSEIEHALAREYNGWIAGVDEVGRGPLAGPVVAAAVILPVGGGPQGIADSKTLSRSRRESLSAALRREAVAIGVGWATSTEIDRHNIRRATHLAMARAVSRLATPPAHVLVDGTPADLPFAHTAIVKGDARCACIGAASIVAKVVRDRFMMRLAQRHPAYGFATNMGYPTKEHRLALARVGPCRHHRKSFAPVRAALASPQPQ